MIGRQDDQDEESDHQKKNSRSRQAERIDERPKRNKEVENDGEPKQKVMKSDKQAGGRACKIE